MENDFLSDDNLLTAEQKQKIIEEAEHKRRIRVKNYNDKRGFDSNNIIMLFVALPLTLLALITTFGTPWIPVIWGFVIYKWIKNNEIKKKTTSAIPYIPMSEKDKKELISTYEWKMRNSLK